MGPARRLTRTTDHDTDHDTSEADMEDTQSDLLDLLPDRDVQLDLFLSDYQTA